MQTVKGYKGREYMPVREPMGRHAFGRFIGLRPRVIYTPSGPIARPPGSVVRRWDMKPSEALQVLDANPKRLLLRIECEDFDLTAGYASLYWSHDDLKAGSLIVRGARVRSSSGVAHQGPGTHTGRVYLLNQSADVLTVYVTEGE